MYKLIKDATTDKICVVLCVEISAYIPLTDPANTDYQQFKQAINDDTAQLETADGVLMTQDEAKAFVATLP